MRMKEIKFYIGANMGNFDTKVEGECGKDKFKSLCIPNYVNLSSALQNRKGQLWGGYL